MVFKHEIVPLTRKQVKDKHPFFHSGDFLELVKEKQNTNYKIASTSEVIDIMLDIIYKNGVFGFSKNSQRGKKSKKPKVKSLPELLKHDSIPEELKPFFSGRIFTGDAVVIPPIGREYRNNIKLLSADQVREYSNLLELPDKKIISGAFDLNKNYSESEGKEIETFYELPEYIKQINKLNSPKSLDALKEYVTKEEGVWKTLVPDEELLGQFIDIAMYCSRLISRTKTNPLNCNVELYKRNCTGLMYIALNPLTEGSSIQARSRYNLYGKDDKVIVIAK